MKNRYTVPAVCLAALLSHAAGLQAQTEQTEKNLNREMTLEREYDPSVQDASKVNTLPEIKEPVVTKMVIDYASYTVPAIPAQEISLLPPGKIMTQIDYNKRRGYFNFGGGTHLNLNGDLGYHILNDDINKLNIWVSHRSTNGKNKYLQVDQKQKAKLNDNIGGINFDHTFQYLTLNMGLKYAYSAFNYYGIPEVSSISSADLSSSIESLGVDRDKDQVLQTVQAQVGVTSKENDAMRYHVQLGYTNFSRKYSQYIDVDGVRQHAFNLDLDFHAPFDGDKCIGIAGNFNYFNYSNEGEKDPYYYHFDSHLQGTLTPYFKVDAEDWRLKIGANVMLITGDDKKFTASPDIEFAYTVANKTELYAQATGGLIANSPYQISQENRYINPSLNVLTSRRNVDALLGIKSAAAGSFWFDLFAGYQYTKNDVFFIPAYFSSVMADFGNALDVDQANSQHLLVGLNMKYSFQQLVDLHLKGIYNHWSISHEDEYYEQISSAYPAGNDEKHKAYGKPEFELNAGITVRPTSKITALMDYNLLTNRYTPQVKMKNINELNLTGIYDLNDTFGFYVKLNNLLFQKQELYYGYPLQRFSAMVGVNINF